MNCRYCLVLTLLAVAGCGSNAPAPVVDRTPVIREKPGVAVATVAPPEAAPGDYYTVKKGDTLYTIALDHGLDYKDIAAWNSIDNANVIKVGQQLRVKPPNGAAPAPVAETLPVQAPPEVESRPLETQPSQANPAEGRPPAAAAGPNTETLKVEPRGGAAPYSDEAWAQLQPPQVPVAEASEPAAEAASATASAPAAVAPPVAPAVGEEAIIWGWPAQGHMTAAFNDESNKGIDIAGKPGQPVFAAAAGKVTLVSSALRGYGNLVVVKHNTGFLSVYAHNSKILVQEGQTVAKGQQIADIGSSDAEQPGLHFEIRHMGKPVDPLQYLPKR